MIACHVIVCLILCIDKIAESYDNMRDDKRISMSDPPENND